MNNTLMVGDLHIGDGQTIGKPASDGSLNSRILDQIHILDWILGRALE